jgi:hypothetical protein
VIEPEVIEPDMLPPLVVPPEGGVVRVAPPVTPPVVVPPSVRTEAFLDGSGPVGIVRAGALVAPLAAGEQIMAALAGRQLSTTPASTLPRTGANAAALSCIAVLSILLGAAAVHVARRMVQATASA